MLSQNEKHQLKAVLSDPKFAVVETTAKLLLAKIKEDSCLKETEWETLKEALLQEGQQQGITRFLQELYRNIKDI